MTSELHAPHAIDADTRAIAADNARLRRELSQLRTERDAIERARQQAELELQRELVRRRALEHAYEAQAAACADSHEELKVVQHRNVLLLLQAQRLSQIAQRLRSELELAQQGPRAEEHPHEAQSHHAVETGAAGQRTRGHRAWARHGQGDESRATTRPGALTSA